MIHHAQLQQLRYRAEAVANGEVTIIPLGSVDIIFILTIICIIAG